MKFELITPDQALTVIDDELFDRISDDYTTIENLVLHKNHLYIGAFDPDLIGFARMHPENRTTMTIHINIPEKHRDRAKLMPELFFAEMKSGAAPEVQKFICKIPVIYPEVYNFAKFAGFEDEGLDKKSIMKGGKLIDRYIMGLQRENIHG